MPRKSLRQSPLLPIFLIVAVDVLGLTIILPLLPFYAERFGASPAVVGLLVSTYAVCQLISGPILGQISDRTGRRPMLLISQLGTFLGFIMLANARSLAMVFLSRVIDGITAGNLSLAQAYISDVTEPENRAKSFGLIGVAFGLGFLVGPGISGYLAQYSYRYPIELAAGLSALSILATYTLLLEAPIKKESPSENPGPGGKRLGFLQWGNYLRYFRNPDLGRLLLRFFLFAISFSTFSSGFALFAERRYFVNGIPFGPKQVGYVFMYTGFLGVILQGGLIGRLVKRFGEHQLSRIGFVASAVGYGILALTHHVPGLLVTAAVASFGMGVLRPSLTSLISQAAGKREQGVVLGLTQSLSSVAQILAPIAAGLLINHLLLKTWGWLAGSAALLALFV